MSFKEWLWQADSSLWDPMDEANTGKSQGDLIYSLSNEWYSAADREQTQDFFKEMGLPLPQKGEFIDTRDMSPLVFLARYGLVIRIMPKNLMEKIERTNGHDLVLQPLKIHRLQTAGIAILPGVDLVEDLRFKSDTFRDFIVEEGKKTKLAPFDLGYNNIGLLPRLWDIEGERLPFPAIVDYGSFNPIPHDLTLSEQFNGAAWHGIQNQIFAPVKDSILNALPDGQSTPNYVSLRRFFHFCRDIVELPRNEPNRILTNGWEIPVGVGCKTVEARKSAQNYERSIQRGP